MKNKILDIIVFVISTVCLIISLKLFWNTAVFCDEFNTSPAKVLGGNLYLILDWGRLLLLAVISFISFIRILKNK